MVPPSLQCGNGGGTGVKMGEAPDHHGEPGIDISVRAIEATELLAVNDEHRTILFGADARATAIRGPRQAQPVAEDIV